MKYALLLLAAAGALSTGCTEVETSHHDHAAPVTSSTTTTESHSVRSAPVGATTSSTTVHSY